MPPPSPSVAARGTSRSRSENADFISVPVAFFARQRIAGEPRRWTSSGWSSVPKDVWTGRCERVEEVWPADERVDGERAEGVHIERVTRELHIRKRRLADKRAKDLVDEVDEVFRARRGALGS